jgi:hypothetical protein
VIGDRIHIGHATNRDASWVTAHMRSGDRQEVSCQFPAATDLELGVALASEQDAFIAYRDGHPVMLFGVSPMCQVGLSVWALGTDQCKRVIPHVTRFFINELMPRKMKEGFKWMEARSISTHYEAHEWMRKTGAEPRLTLQDYGNGGEDFILFRWTKSSYHTAAARRWRTNNASK